MVIFAALVLIFDIIIFIVSFTFISPKKIHDATIELTKAALPGKKINSTSQAITDRVSIAKPASTPAPAPVSKNSKITVSVTTTKKKKAKK
jgi:hypothetical protein